MYKFTPILKTLVWGMESWVLSSVPGSESVVSEGPDEGRTLGEVYGRNFPLLIKFIDARKDLSVQVHPNDSIASVRHGCSGKTEMWYIMKAEKGTRLISGFSRKIDKEEYVSLVEKGEILSVLSSHTASPGDVFYLPAGRVHAIGAGCLLAEVQQSSDITYRIFDYNRPGLDGKPRQLHTEMARDAIEYDVRDDYRTHYTPEKNSEVELVDCPYFNTGLLCLDSPKERSLADCRDFLALVCLKGRGMLTSGSGGRLSLQEGEAVLVLKSEKDVLIEPDGEMKILTAHI